MNDLISRKWLVECLEEGWIKLDTEKDYNRMIHLVRDTAPSAQPEADEWCKDCKEYNIANHNCPRFIMTIKKTVEEMKEERKKGQWIPVDSFSAFGGDESMWIAHGNPVAFYYCSSCKEQAYVGEDGQSLITDFCPICGSDMRGETDES